MKFGLCAGLDAIAEAAKLGFAYLEPPVSSTAALSDEAFAEKLAMVKAASIPCLAFNLLFPASLRLLSASDGEIAAYLRGAMARVEALGGGVVVFGSGRSRSRPEGMAYGDAFRRLVEVTRLTGRIAAEHGVTLVIEPLNRGESNMVCSMAEGATLVAATNEPSVKLLSDYYHVATDGEPISDIVRLGGVSHTHIATKAGRRYPTSCADDDFAGFFAALRETDYQGLMSVEGGTDDIAVDAPAALALLRGLWGR